MVAGQSASSGSRAEASILKANPAIVEARLRTSSPTVYEESPPPESESDFLSDVTMSAGETPNRAGTGPSTYYYSGPLSESQGGSNRWVTNVDFVSRTGRLHSAADDP